MSAAPNTGWKYQEVLNVDLVVLLVVTAGFMSSWARILHTKEHAQSLNTFVFKFGLPSLVIRGLGIGTNLYVAENWRFICTFLILRVLALAACAAFTWGTHGSLGDAMAYWLAATWISTVILGGPVVSAALGKQYNYLGVLAGVSSFIFQLPLMLAGFEVHRGRLEALGLPPAPGAWRDGGTGGLAPGPRALAPGPGAMDMEAGARAAADGCCPRGDTHFWSNSGTNGASGGTGGAPTALSCSLAALPVGTGATDAGQGCSRCAPESCPGKPGAQAGGQAAPGRAGAGGRAAQRRAVCRSIGARLLHNHVLWGIAIGFALSLSTVGYKYLSPVVVGAPGTPNPRYAGGAGFIVGLLEWLGRCTEPLALFATGMFVHRWAAERGERKAFGVAWVAKAAAYMAVKLLLVPAAAVACAQATRLSDAPGRAAVLIATLPVSLAAFSVSREYGVRQQDMAVNVVLGTLLMLPTTIAWLEFMDAVGLYVVPPGPAA